jgi:TonB family protein
MKYPNQAKIAGIEGIIIITFKVDSTCTFINRKQDIKLGYGCDELVMETLDKMEKDFKKNNKKRCKYFANTMTIPVVFKLR